MDRLQFLSTVRVTRNKDGEVEEIDNVMDAISFLREWPVGRRGPVYRCAMNCCSAAISDQMTAEEARKSFIGFARITRLLVDHEMPAHIAEHANIQKTIAH